MLKNGQTHFKNIARSLKYDLPFSTLCMKTIKLVLLILIWAGVFQLGCCIHEIPLNKVDLNLSRKRSSPNLVSNVMQIQASWFVD